MIHNQVVDHHQIDKFAVPVIVKPSHITYVIKSWKHYTTMVETNEMMRAVYPLNITDM